jgi:integrase
MPKKKARSYIRSQWPKVQRVKIREEVRYRVDGRPHKGRLFFQEKNDAEVQAEVWSREQQNQGIEALEFPTKMRMDATEAAKLLKPFGRSLIDAAKHYVAHLEAEQRKQTAISLQNCLDEWIQSKKAEAARGIISKRTIHEIEGRAKLFRSAFKSARISEIDEETVRSFLDSLPVTQRTRLNIRTKLGQFLNYCRLRKWITQNPASTIKVKVPSSEVSILTPEEAKALLKGAQDYSAGQSLVPYAAISLFAGLRPGEAEQLRWEKIHIETGQIEVLGKTSKTRETRFVRIQPTLKKWLLAYRGNSGLIIGPNFRKHWEAVRKSAGYSFKGEPGNTWPADVMRHSFGSYWLPIHADRPRLAEEMGNTVEVIKAHYKRAIPRGVAEEFWKIQPPKKLPSIGVDPKTHPPRVSIRLRHAAPTLPQPAIAAPLP